MADNPFPGYEYFNYQSNQLLLQAQQAASKAYDDAFQRALALGYQQLDADKFAAQQAQYAANLELQRAGLVSDNAFKALNLVASLGGPANAFQQQAVISGLNQSGLSRAVDAIAGNYEMPSFQAPQAAPQPQTYQSLVQQITGQGGAQMPYAGQAALGGGSVSPYYPPGYQQQYQGAIAPILPGTDYYSQQQPWYASYGQQALPQTQPAPAAPAGQPPTTQPAPTQGRSLVSQPAYAPPPPPPRNSLEGYADYLANPSAPAYAPQGTQFQAPQAQQQPYSTSAAAYGAALPAPNQIVGRQWTQMPDSTKQFLLSAYKSQGWDPGDVQYQIQQGLPQFRAPGTGAVI